MSRELDILTGVILDEQSRLDLSELTRVCGIARATLAEMVAEDLLRPLGQAPDDWLFPGPQVRRARRAARLMRDLELSVHATALVLELLEELEQLRSRSRDLEQQLGLYRRSR